MALTDFALERHPTRMSRQTQLVNAKTMDKLSVLIIGAGSIGSNAAHACLSMGIHDISLVDHDIVKEENIFPSWLYPIHIGKPKVEAVRLQLLDYGVVANAYQSTIENLELENPFNIVIAATDQIESRLAAFDKLHGQCDWWLDGRMGGPDCELFAINANDEQERDTYKSLELRPVNSDLLCGEKSTAYNTKGTLVQFIGWAIRDIAGGRKPPYQQVGRGYNEETIRAEKVPVLQKEKK